MKVIGIDPGKSGFAVLTDFDYGILVFHKFKFMLDNKLDISNFKRFISDTQPDCIVMEKTMGRGGVWGATQNYNFGFICGQILTTIREAILVKEAISHTALEMPTPLAWQNAVCKGIPKTKAGAKERTMNAYHNLFPYDPLSKIKPFKKIDDNLLDAFMVSVYGQIKFAKISNFYLEYKGNPYE